MHRRITSLLLAGVAAASLPLAQPASALLEPVYDCGFVAVRDIVNMSTNTWIAVEYAYVSGIPIVHANIRLTCWAQHVNEYTGTPSGFGDYTPFGGSAVAGLTITCAASGSVPTNVCTNAPTAYVNPTTGIFYTDPPRQMYWCAHLVWDDTVTNFTNFTRRSDPCRSIPSTRDVTGTNLV